MKTVGASSNFLQTLRSLSLRTLALFERSEFAKFLGRNELMQEKSLLFDCRNSFLPAGNIQLSMIACCQRRKRAKACLENLGFCDLFSSVRLQALILFIAIGLTSKRVQSIRGAIGGAKTPLK